MSFSGKVREELSENISQARHCRIAELAAFIGSAEQYRLTVLTDIILRFIRKISLLQEKSLHC